MSKKGVITKINSAVKLGDDEFIADDDVWTVVQSWVDQNGFNAAQIQHFNSFIYEGIPRVLKNFQRTTISENDVTYIFEITDHFIETPHTLMDNESRKLYPTEALQRNIAYDGHIYLNISISPPRGDNLYYDRVNAGKIPIMVLSDLCNMTGIYHDPVKMAKHREDFMDVGGYFITSPKGDNAPGSTAQKRVLGAQERGISNRVQVFANRRKQRPKFLPYAEIKSNGGGMRMTTTIIGILNERISVVLPWIDSVEIPIGVLFHAFGVIDFEDMMLLIFGPDYKNDKAAIEFFAPSLEYSYECETQESALLFIGKRGRKFAVKADDFEEDEEDQEDIDMEETVERIHKDAVLYAQKLLLTEVFPHITAGMPKTGEYYGHSLLPVHIAENFQEKAKYLGYATKKLIWVALGRREPEDRDHYCNKRIVTAGELLEQQFYAAVRKLITEITTNTRKALKNGNNVNILSWIKPAIITNAMSGAISGNNWASGGPTTKGISQLYEQYNYTAGISNMRKLTVPMAAEGGKVIAPRDVHGSHFGGVCPAESPEGKKAGLVKNMAFMAQITIGSDYKATEKIVKTFIGDSYQKRYPKSLGWTRVFLNGVPLGEIRNYKRFVKKLISARRNAQLDAETSIAYIEDSNEVQISVDAGRLCRPLFIIDNGKLLFTKEHVNEILEGEVTWTHLLAKGVVELIDKSEEEHCLIAGYPSDIETMSEDMAKEYTHCEIHPSLMYGIGGSIIPFSHHNQSPRNCYQAAMGKQAIGIPFTNYRHVMSGTFHTLGYLQKPLCISRAGSIVRFDDMPAGQNAIVAIMPRPFNEEDSIEMNEDSVGRGFMVSYKWTCFYAEVKEKEFFGIPDDTKCDRIKGNHNGLTDEGFPKPGTILNNGDVVIGKYEEGESDEIFSSGKRMQYKDRSILYESPWPARVDKIQLGTTGEGYHYVRVMVCQKRIPIIGDKFAARHGQKGTIGKLVKSYDLPFNSDGIAPDIVVNSLALPSRMTIAMLCEQLTGKVICSSSPLHTIELNSVLGDNNHDNAFQNVQEEYKTHELSDIFVNNFIHPEDSTTIDATPYKNPKRLGAIREIDIIRTEMVKYGLDCGEERMRDGETGKNLKSLVFFGPVFYQRLKHMAIDKFHARARGGKTALTRQPKEGRAMGGGLRCGVMERDCILGQGAAKFERDRLMECSDKFTTWTCQVCGLASYIERGMETGECSVCGSDKIVAINIPYGTKLVNQELQAMNIVPRILTTKHTN